MKSQPTTHPVNRQKGQDNDLKESNLLRGYIALTPTASLPEWESKNGGAPMTEREMMQLYGRETMEEDQDQ